jgi:hypothetical protein
VQAVPRLQLIKVAAVAVVRRGLLRRVVVVLAAAAAAVVLVVVRVRHKVLRAVFGLSRACGTRDSVAHARAAHLAA